MHKIVKKKMTVKAFIMLQLIYFRKKGVILVFLFIKEFWKKKKKTPTYQTKSEWILKDHVTVKTGLMAAKNSALPLQE